MKKFFEILVAIVIIMAIAVIVLAVKSDMYEIKNEETTPAQVEQVVSEQPEVEIETVIEIETEEVSEDEHPEE